MPAIYKFRVTFEDHDDVHRDIEVRSTQTFEDLHLAVQKAINFDNKHPASFYMSDAAWTRGKEITLRDLKEDEKGKVLSMKKSRLVDFINDPHQRFYYLFDFSVRWGFYVELIKILLKEEPGTDYPRVVKTAGKAPVQYKVVKPGKGDTVEEESAPPKLVEEEEQVFAGLADEEGVDKIEEGDGGEITNEEGDEEGDMDIGDFDISGEEEEK